MTVSFWMKTQQTSEGTALSYATQSQAEELVITTHPRVSVILKGSSQGTGGSWNLNDGNWHFLWIEWQSSNGHLTIREGTRTIGPLTYTRSALAAGGYLVLGQRQQSQKQFVAAKAFVGEISHVNIWSEKRTDFNVIRKDCIGLHTGTVFHLSDDTIETRQSASIIAADTCPGKLSSLFDGRKPPVITPPPPLISPIPGYRLIYLETKKIHPIISPPPPPRIKAPLCWMTALNRAKCCFVMTF